MTAQITPEGIAAMARYVFLMYDSEDWHDTVDEQGVADEFRLHEEFMAAVTAAGASVVGGEALERSSTASTVRRGGGTGPLVTDGPFADTKEALGGFYVIDAPDLDVALRLAAACPSGNVEVRPVMEMPDDAA
ncbi:YciI family protein [Pseudonocardia nantongensis]|uniref:YciI family protein n=1 Tax=Pseudonocardia nantongensis TaxID=1181885 RepID=UPI00397BF990